MEPQREEQLYASLQRGMQAASDLSVARPVIEARMQKIIREGINAVNSLIAEKQLTDREAMLKFVALAANQNILDDLEAVQREGERAYKKLQE